MIETSDLQESHSTYSLYTESFPSSWIEINKEALYKNIESYKRVISSKLFAVVIKSNAYGHGLEQIALLCNQHPAINMLCVVSLKEALQLRSLNIQKPLLVLSIVDNDLKSAVEQNISLVIYDMHMLHELNEKARALGKKASIHIKVDTGLSRLGILYEEAVLFIQQAYAFSHIFVQGIFTHFAESENEDQTFTHLQLQRFNSILQHLELLNIKIPLQHTTCSAATTAYSQSHFTMVRLGIGLYGLWPSTYNKKITQQTYPHFSLYPVLSWKTGIIHLKEVPSHSFVGYDLTYQTTRPTRIATLPIGYWDGYDRRLSNRGKVSIRNQFAPIIGRIAMNLCMVDVTGLDVTYHDEVILLGNQEGITADNLAEVCDTINYEIVTRINPLLPRKVA